MQLVNHANLSIVELGKLDGLLPDHNSMAEVTEWGFKQTPPLQVTAVVTQDEFTHDIVIPWRGNLFLVYGAT